jgi:hypothetical protein
METSNSIQTREDYSTRVAALRCPRCGGENLHHLGVISYDRSKEDDPTTVINLSAGRITSATHDDASANPSSRRGGLAIQFGCELCHGVGENRIELTIAQHKGTTEIGWRFDPLA